MPQDEAEIFEPYRVLRRGGGSLWKLGAGAIGVTYKAIDTNLDAHVALKVINAGLLDRDTLARDRFVREAKAAASLHHPNVATIYHLGHCAGSYFYATEFFSGETVEDRVKRTGPMRVEAALALALQAAEALMAVHQAGLAHRDIKPSNLMLVNDADEDGVIKLIDFGLARSVMRGAAALSPAYASPEQCQELPAGIRSDIYSLGATLWFMLTGEPPFRAESALELQASHIKAEPPWENLAAIRVPGSVCGLLRRMLAKDPDLRPHTPEALRGDLEGCLRACAAAPAADPGEAREIPGAPQAPLGQRKLFSRTYAPVLKLPALAEASAAETAPAAFADAASPPLVATVRRKRRRRGVKRADKSGPWVKIAVFALAGLMSIAVLGRLARAPSTKSSAKPSTTPGAKPSPEPSATPGRNEDYETGVNLWNGMGRALIDQTQAVAHLQAAAAKGYAPAQAFLAVVYRDGFGGAPRDEFQAEEWAKASLEAGLREEAQQGDAEAQLRLGLLYDEGLGVQKDPAKAVELYKKAVDQGNASAQFSLGICYFNGSGVAKDLAKAADLYKKAADQGNAFAQNNLGFCRQIGSGVAQDLAKAVALYKESAAQGNAIAQKNLGVCYFNGIGVEKDLAKAVELFQKAADRGYPLAEFNLGVCYESGIGLEKDLNKAIELYKKAARQGNPDAQNNLGFCYENGIGVEKDRDKAVEFYIKAADQGNDTAQARLRSLLHGGAK